tara:strand:- start:71 stop:421 length:351 start_codon:yes stop_codon:yes gene_type:complete
LPGASRSSIKNHIAKGSWAEAVAVAWLFARGWSVVAKNVSGWGFVDLVALKLNGNHKPVIELIDVKSFNETSKSYNPLTLEQKYAGVRVICVHDDGHVDFIEKGKERVRDKNESNS